MAFGIDDAIGAVSKLLDDGISAAFPTPEAKASAEAVKIKATTDAAIAQLQAQNSIMLAEAQNSDKWTSRARPSFLYVVYALILTAIPYSVFWAFAPDSADHMATGLQKWLAAIPPDLWNVFGVGYLGYTVARSGEKAGGILPFLSGNRK